MTEECITNKVQILVFSRQSTFMDHKIAFSLITLVQILLWSDLENIVTHLEANWLHLFGHILTWRLNVAECLVRFAIQLWQAGCPLLSDLFKDIGWYRELRASSIYYRWIAGVLSWLLHGLGSVSHSLSLESPGTKPVWEVLERLEAVGSVDNLRGIVPTEEGVRRLVHFLRCNAEADHGVIDDTVVLKGPEIMQLLLAHVFMWRQS